MDNIDTSFTLDPFRLMRRGTKKDYKEKLERNPVWGHAPAAHGANPTVSPYAKQIRCLATQSDVSSVAFQCTVVAALQTIHRVRSAEQQVADAALSLAQQQKLDTMLGTVDAVASALHDLLTPQGAKMLAQQKPARADTPEHLWWFALSEALHMLEEGLTWIRSVTAGQAQGGATRTLSRIISLLLYAHYRALFTEAEQWMN